jgi:hypothetical protein
MIQGKQKPRFSKRERGFLLSKINYALQEIEKATRIKGIPFEGKTVVLKEQVAPFFEVTPRTIDNYIEKFVKEGTPLTKWTK